jgi:hypothetical protein
VRKVLTVSGPALGDVDIKVLLGLVGKFGAPGFLYAVDDAFDLATLAGPWAKRQDAGQSYVRRRDLEQIAEAFARLAKTSLKVDLVDKKTGAHLARVYPETPLLGFNDRTPLEVVRVAVRGFALWDRHMDMFRAVDAFNGRKWGIVKNACYFPEPFGGPSAVAVRAHCLLTAYLPPPARDDSGPTGRHGLPRRLGKAFHFETVAAILGRHACFAARLHDRYLPDVEAVAAHYLLGFDRRGENMCIDYHPDARVFY